MRTAENLRFFFYAENDPADRRWGMENNEKRENSFLNMDVFV
jgi:hypothetical protein